MHAYDYNKAAKLDAKACALVRSHRAKVFDENGDLHSRAIRRINRLMAEYRRSLNRQIVGAALTRMGY